MNTNSNLSKILFLDIETVAQHASFDQLSTDLKELWSKKAQLILKGSESTTDLDIANCYQEKAGIYAEFGKIVCISVGVLTEAEEDEELHCRIKSFKGHDETLLLQDFCEMINQYFHDIKIHKICGHNIKEFDIPYICRRLVINQLELPNLLNIAGRKPWDLSYLLDTMAFWKFGDYKNYTSLKLLTAILDIPSPKDDIDGSEVNEVYWQTSDLDRIARYCEKDVLAVIQLYFRFQYLPLLQENAISYV